MRQLGLAVARVVAGVVLLVLAVEAVFGRESTGLLGLPYWDGIPTGVMVNGAVIGTLYGLVAFGIILVYKANRIINFAQAGLGGGAGSAGPAAADRAPRPLPGVRRDHAGRRRQPRSAGRDAGAAPVLASSRG